MPPSGSSQTVIVPVDGLDSAVLRTIEYARSLSQNVTAVHITDDLSRGGDAARRVGRADP